VIECRRSSGYDSAQAIADGLQECAASGVTAVGDIAQIDAGSCDFDAAPLNITNFFELIALTPDRIASAESFLRNEFSRRQTTATRTCGLSPHAPYTVHPELLKSIVSFSSQKSAPIAMHLAESREEMQLLAEGNGPIRDFLAERNLFDQATFPGGKRPLDYLKLLAGAARTLIIHGNYLDEEEIAFLAERNDRMGVVFCPRTHAFFAHPKYPLEKMLSAGVKVAFGTDSRASSPDLSLLGELRFAFRLYPQIGGEVILRMGTLDAAKILGREQEIGSLEPGKWANLAVVALPDTVTTSPDADLLSIETPVLQTWYQGTRIR
jgi:cytosine/adenosine deaminase-related metal-dependent hydrolase